MLNYLVLTLIVESDFSIAGDETIRVPGLMAVRRKVHIPSRAPPSSLTKNSNTLFRMTTSADTNRSALWHGVISMIVGKSDSSIKCIHSSSEECILFCSNQASTTILFHAKILIDIVSDKNCTHLVVISEHSICTLSVMANF